MQRRFLYDPDWVSGGGSSSSLTGIRSGASAWVRVKMLSRLLQRQNWDRVEAALASENSVWDLDQHGGDLSDVQLESSRSTNALKTSNPFDSKRDVAVCTLLLRGISSCPFVASHIRQPSAFVAAAYAKHGVCTFSMARTYISGKAWALTMIEFCV
jgi:hypothetical protein